MLRRLCLLVVVPFFLNFDYDSYKLIGEDYYRDISENYEKRDGPGLGVYYERVRFNIIMKEFPAPISEGGMKSVEHYGKLAIRKPEYAQAFDHELRINLNGIKYVLVFQSVLIPHLRKEFKSGKNLLLFASYGLFDTFGKEHFLFVNEFSVEPKANTLAKVPIVKQRLYGFTGAENSSAAKEKFPPALLVIAEYGTGVYSIKADLLGFVHYSTNLDRKCNPAGLCNYLYDGNVIWSLQEEAKSLRIVEAPKDEDSLIFPAQSQFNLISSGRPKDSALSSEIEYSADHIFAINKSITFRKENAPVPVVKDGKVVVAEAERGPYGGIVIVDHGKCFQTVYYPLRDIQVKEGESVVATRVVGTTSETTNWPRIKGLVYLVLQDACGSNPFAKGVKRINPEKPWGK